MLQPDTQVAVEIFRQQLKRPTIRPLIDSDSKTRVQKISKSTEDYLYRLANEPSLGLYHVQEHVHKCVPRLVDLQKELRKTRQQIDEVTYDIDYTLTTVQDLEGLPTFQSINQLMHSSIAMLNDINSGQTTATRELSSGKVTGAIHKKTTDLTSKQF
jgi:hypothetical protein